MDLRVSFLAILFSSILLGMLSFGIFFLAVESRQITQAHQDKEQELAEAAASLETVLNELHELSTRSTMLQASMGETMQALMGLGSIPAGIAESGSGVLQAIRAPRSVDDTLPEVEELRRISAVLSEAVDPLRRIQDVLSSHSDILRDIPHHWPVIAGRGRVTMEFGPHVHPFTGQWYLHQGFDIADTPGVPVVAAADGRVISTGYDQFSHGWNVIIQHRYGFKTRYSHLRRVTVSDGDYLEQGQQLGSLGNSGLATGPHLHFEVHLGANLIDPAAFLKISSNFERRLGKGRSSPATHFP
jgi:murein DD-endopeptidase MepM/ murein hydrolase activator NlpD